MFHLPSSWWPSVETVAAKCVFEHGVKIQHYHCSNGWFSDNAFKQACYEACQLLTFCGINAHFQNDIVKRSIRNLSESTCKHLLHACACWLQAVHFALWPYALRNAMLLHNSLSVLEDGLSKLGFSAQFVLVATWSMCTLSIVIATMVTLCVQWAQSWTKPNACKDVYLVLNLITGCVSPQYHCHFDDYLRQRVMMDLTFLAPSSSSN